jgi:hypothetical protein
VRFRLRVNCFKGLGVFLCSSDSGQLPRFACPPYPLLSPPRTRGSSPAAALEEPLAPSSLDPRFRGGDTVTRPARNLQFKARPPPFRGCRRHSMISKASGAISGHARAAIPSGTRRA